MRHESPATCIRLISPIRPIQQFTLLLFYLFTFKYMRICICGGGNLGHVVAGFIASRGTDEVNILTRRPDRWAQTLAIDTPDGGTLHGRLARVSSRPEDIISGCQAVMLCLPGWSIGTTLDSIRPCLSPETAVGSVVSSTGFYFEARRRLPEGTPLFGFQRVPFIARTAEYGHRASLLGYKQQLVMGTESIPAPDAFRLEMERMLATPVVLAKNMYEVSLSNSNPLLHPARLYSLWHDWHEGTVYPRVPMFYEEWDDLAARLYIAMDGELQALLGALPVSAGCIPTVLDYYESHDAASLAAKLRSIKAFKGIPAPMKEVAGGYVPDFTSRYFTEDFPYGLAVIHRLAHEKGVHTPIINKVYEWGKWVQTDTQHKQHITPIPAPTDTHPSPPEGRELSMQC